MDPEGHVVEAGVEVGPSLKLLSDHCKFIFTLFIQ